MQNNKVADIWRGICYVSKGIYFDYNRFESDTEIIKLKKDNIITSILKTDLRFVLNHPSNLLLGRRTVMNGYTIYKEN